MADISCRGRLMLYAPDEGDCDLGDGCAAYTVRWTDHVAYIDAHRHISSRVAVADEMIAAQAGCDIDEALQLLIIRTKSLGQSMEITALDVLDGIIRFDL
jgi:hypothetical protein